MLPIINIVHTAIHAGKDLSSLNIGNKGLSSLNGVVTAGLPKLTLSQNLWEQVNQFIVRFNPTYPKTEHMKNKELIAKVLGGDVYHAAKVQGYIKDQLKEGKLEEFSDSEFARLKTRCDKIRSPQVLLGVFTQIMLHEQMAPLLKNEQLETLLSSLPDLKKTMNKGMEVYQKFHSEKKASYLNKGMQLRKEQLFVLQTLYDHSSKNNITSEQLSNMDENKKTTLFSVISEGTINSCLDKRNKFEKSLFREEMIKQVKDRIFQAVKEDLYCLEYTSLAAKQTN